MQAGGARMYATQTPIEKNYMVSIIENGSEILRSSKKKSLSPAGRNNTPLKSHRDAAEKINTEYVSPIAKKTRLPKKRILKKG